MRVWSRAGRSSRSWPIVDPAQRFGKGRTAGPLRGPGRRRGDFQNDAVGVFEIERTRRPGRFLPEFDLRFGELLAPAFQPRDRTLRKGEMAHIARNTVSRWTPGAAQVHQHD